MQDIVEAIVFLAGAVGLSSPCLLRIGANGRYTYDTAKLSEVIFCSTTAVVDDVLDFDRAVFGFRRQGKDKGHHRGAVSIT